MRRTPYVSSIYSILITIRPDFEGIETYMVFTPIKMEAANYNQTRF
ncbi:hypothetical protein NNO_2066 [Hydrogenimonas sp.]|nr:hypothetical protein NNO_2066 [Hydrogenimonas sp.]